MRMRIRLKERKVGWAKLIRWLQPSNWRIIPRCLRPGRLRQALYTHLHRVLRHFINRIVIVQQVKLVKVSSLPGARSFFTSHKRTSPPPPLPFKIEEMWNKSGAISWCERGVRVFRVSVLGSKSCFVLLSVVGNLWDKNYTIYICTIC